jgi:hypothetical protein
LSKPGAPPHYEINVSPGAYGGGNADHLHGGSGTDYVHGGGATDARSGESMVACE